MEVRCGKCNKLFRVSDDKITGRGIKFTCTRCGESVKITREAFENSMQAQSAISSLGLFEPAAGPSGGPVPGQETAAAGTAAPLPFTAEGAGMGEAAVQGHETGEVPTPGVPDFLQEREEPPSPEPNPFEESSSLMEQQPHVEPVVPSGTVREEMRAEPEAPVEPEPRDEPVIAVEPKQETAPKAEPEPDGNAGLEYARKSERVMEPGQEPLPITATTAGTGTGDGPAVQARPAAPVSASSGVLTAESAKRPVRQAGTIPQKAAKETAPPAPARSGRFLMVMLAAFLILGLAGLGAYLYIQSAPPSEKDSGTGAVPMVSMEGLQIVNPVGSLDSNGDLLVSGALENTTDRERAEWYIVVEVFDAKGTVLNTIRMLNGRQIYTKRDYEILAKRGANVQELKAQALQARGVVLPPKGKTAFEIRYLQPPDGIASFNPTLQPFDPARLLKEIEGETR